MLSHGCDIDKTSKVLVAHLAGVADAPDGLWGNIRAGRVWHALHIPGTQFWVNLRDIRMVEKELLAERLDARSHGMTDDGRKALAAKVFSFLARVLPPEAIT